MKEGRGRERGGEERRGEGLSAHSCAFLHASEAIHRAPSPATRAARGRGFGRRSVSLAIGEIPVISATTKTLP